MDTFMEEFYDNQLFRELRIENSLVQGITFLGCAFMRCSLRETEFKSCKFQSCVFNNCDLSLMKVENSVFTQTKFEDCKIIGVNWVKASWGKTEIHSLLKTIDFDGCVLNYSTFMGLNLEKMRIKKCIAHEVDFSDANLRQADCSFTDFSKSHFRHTDLSAADFRGATNYFIQPQLNTLKKTQFSLPEALSLLYNLDIEISAPPGEENEENGAG